MSRDVAMLSDMESRGWSCRCATLWHSPRLSARCWSTKTSVERSESTAESGSKASSPTTRSLRRRSPSIGNCCRRHQPGSASAPGQRISTRNRGEQRMSRGMVLITGATGFIGGALLTSLGARGWDIAGATRSAHPLPGMRRAPELDAHADWSPLVGGCAAVVHAAARVHVMRETASDSLAEFRRVNVDGPLALARHAARAGVRRFVFLSSVKVNGEETAPGRPFGHDDVPAPVDPYGISKLEA